MNLMGRMFHFIDVKKRIRRGIMRIGIDGHMIGDHSGGNESYYTNILLNMDCGNDEVYLFVKKNIAIDKFRDRGFHIVEFDEESALRRNFIEIPKLCKQYSLDVIHLQYFIPVKTSCPIVCTIHDICFEHYRNIFTKKEYIRQKLLIPYAAKHSEYIFTVSNDAKKDIVEHYKVCPDKVIVTYNAVDSSFRVLDDDELRENELREQFGIGDVPYVLSVGNLQPRKNLPRLIRAFGKISNEIGADTKLVIVGKKAWMYSDILKEACNDTQRVIFTDYVSGQDLVRLYNAAECFVYPSFFEGFGIPPLEAMACGTPVAVSDKTSLPEVVGDSGVYFNPFDENEIGSAIVKMMNDSSMREMLIAKGLVRATEFSWKDSSNIIMEIYHKFQTH